MSVAAASSGGATGAAKVAVPDAPDYTKCVRRQEEDAAEAANGQTAPTDAQLKTQCKQQYVALRDQVMQFLISARWIEGEAKDKGIKVSDADVQKKFNDEKKKSFPKDPTSRTFPQAVGE